MIMKTRIAMTTLAAAGLLAAGAQAGTITPYQEVPNLPSQKGHAGILADLFGGVFVKNGNDYSNGTVNVIRVDDDNDQSYDFLEWEAHAVARWGLAEQSFGTQADGVLFDSFGFGDATGGQTLGNPGGVGIEFNRFGNDFNMVDVSTNPANNADGKDHVITYTWEVNGVPAENRYLLFFEDSDDTSEWTDTDFNDLVVELIGTPIPEPTSLALLGMGGLAMLRRRRS